MLVLGISKRLKILTEYEFFSFLVIVMANATVCHTAHSFKIQILCPSNLFFLITKIPEIKWKKYQKCQFDIGASGQMR